MPRKYNNETNSKCFLSLYIVLKTSEDFYFICIFFLSLLLAAATGCKKDLRGVVFVYILLFQCNLSQKYIKKLKFPKCLFVANNHYKATRFD